MYPPGYLLKIHVSTWILTQNTCVHLLSPANDPLDRYTLLHITPGHVSHLPKYLITLSLWGKWHVEYLPRAI